MKKIVLFMIIVLRTSSINAQDNYSIDYRQGRSNDMCRIVFNDSLCYCYAYNWYDIHRKQKVLGNRCILFDVFYNRNTDQLLWHLELTRKKNFLVIDTARYNWVYVAETKTIKGYECLAAYSVLKPGDTTFAFYSKDIRYPFGPFGVVGLPGAVLELYDACSESYWIAEKIKKTDAVIVLPEKARVIGWEEWEREL